MKEIVRSVGTLAIWWVVGSAIQAAAWALRSADDDSGEPEEHFEGDSSPVRLVA